PDRVRERPPLEPERLRPDEPGRLRAEDEDRRLLAAVVRVRRVPARAPVERRRPPERRRLLRWSLGTSARTTAPASCGIRPARYLAIRSSSRRIARASCAVSRSSTDSANASIAV